MIVMLSGIHKEPIAFSYRVTGCQPPEAGDR